VNEGTSIIDDDYKEIGEYITPEEKMYFNPNDRKESIFSTSYDETNRRNKRDSRVSQTATSITISIDDKSIIVNMESEYPEDEFVSNNRCLEKINSEDCENYQFEHGEISDLSKNLENTNFNGN